MNVTAADAEKVLECEMKISHIVTNGCSYTYCQGLPNMIVDGWPAQIANNFNCPVVNLGIPGVGNDSIHRRTYEYIYENLSVDQYKPLVIIEWSQKWRKESWLNKELDYIHVTYPDTDVQKWNNNQKALLDNWNDEDFIRRTILYKLSLINLFENLNIPFLMFDYDGSDGPCEKKDKVKMNFPTMYGFSQNKFDMGSLCHLTGALPKLPCGHDDIDGQNALNKTISNKIKEVYPQLEFVNNSKFLTLNDYIKTSKYHRKFPEWCNFKLKDDILP
jgi:hypothetical protein